MVPYATLRLRLFPHLRWGFANYSIMDSNAFHSRFLRPSRHFMVQKAFCQMKDTISGKNPVQSADIIFQFFT